MSESQTTTEPVPLSEELREPIHPQPPTPVDETPKRQASNLALRLLTAAMLIPPLIWAIFTGGPWVLGIVVVVSWLGVHEFYQLIEAKGAEPLRAFGIVAAVTLPFVVYLGSEVEATLLLSFVLLGVMVAQLGKAQIQESLASISGTFFGVFYVGWLVSHAIVLRNFQSVVGDRWGDAVAATMHPDVGAFYLFFTIFVTIGGDAGAYFAGRAYGKRPLARAISPNKTVEGAIGALLAGVVVALGMKTVFDQFWPHYSANLSLWMAAALGPVLAGVGIMGDLIESLLKRDAQVKDTGSLLPGTGGVLDRVDSNLLAIPVMYSVLLAQTFVVSAVPPLASATAR